MIITTDKLAYNIGFSATLDPKSLGANSDAAKWEFAESRAEPDRLLKFFEYGYNACLELMKEVKNDIVAGKLVLDLDDSDYGPHLKQFFKNQP